MGSIQDPSLYKGSRPQERPEHTPGDAAGGALSASPSPRSAGTAARLGALSPPLAQPGIVHLFMQRGVPRSRWAPCSSQAPPSPVMAQDFRTGAVPLRQRPLSAGFRGPSHLTPRVSPHLAPNSLVPKQCLKAKVT